MRKSFLLVFICVSFQFAYVEAVVATTALSEKVVPVASRSVAKLISFCQKRPFTASLFAGALCAGFIWRTTLYEQLQKTIRDLDHWANDEEKTENKQDVVKKKDKTGRVDNGLLYDHSPGACLLFAELLKNSLDSEKDFENLVEEMSKHESSDLRACFLLAHRLSVGVGALQKRCILAALARRLVAQDGVTEKASLQELVGQDASKIFAHKEQLAGIFEWKVLRYESEVAAVALSFNSMFCLIGLANGDVQVLNLQDGASFIVSHASPVKTVALSPDDKFLATILTNGTVEVVALETRKTRQVAQAGVVHTVTFSSDSRSLATASADGIVQVLDLYHEKTKTITHQGLVTAVVFSPDATRLASAGIDGSVHVRNLLNDSDKVFSHKGRVNALCFSPDNNYLVTASADGSALLINLADYAAKTITHKGPVSHAVFSFNSLLLVTTSDDGEVKITNPIDGSCLDTSARRTRLVNAIHDVAFSVDNRLLATASANNSLVVTNLPSDLAKETLSKHDWHEEEMIHEGPVYKVVFNKDNRFVATVSGDGVGRVFDLQKVVKSKFDKDGQAKMICFSPDAALVGVVSASKQAEIADLEERWKKTLVHDDAITTVAFSADNKFVVSASREGTVKLYKRGLENFGEFFESQIVVEQEKQEKKDK